MAGTRCGLAGTARVIVARHPAPPAGKKVAVGKRVDEWVYELFITTLAACGFLVEDVLDLYHGRGAFEAVLADEDVEEDPDRWCSYTACGQELWQIACQWKSRPGMPRRAGCLALHVVSMLTTCNARQP